ncbi:MAG: hypothetical protein ACR2RB_15950 [Gammaproteobacteria bacterium]
MDSRYFGFMILAPTLLWPGWAVSQNAVLEAEGVALPGVPTTVTARPKTSPAALPINARTTVKAADKKAADPLVSISSTDLNVTLTVKPGTTELVTIARNYLNRIITPFENPKVVTASDIEFHQEGRDVFIGTSSDKPVGVYVMAADPEDVRAISLALVPKAIPPRTLRLQWHEDGMQHTPRTAARRWEESQPFVQTVTALLRDVAKGFVPEGYSLGRPNSEFPCGFDPEIWLTTEQVLEGSHFRVLVLKAVNQGAAPYELAESACAQAGVVAVAAYPNLIVDPGLASELYVVIRRPVPGKSSSLRARPRVTEGGH